MHVTTWSYDKLDLVTRTTDPEGMQTTYAYDWLGRRTEEVRDAAQGGLGIKTTLRSAVRPSQPAVRRAASAE